MMSAGYLTARENEVELLTTKFYNLRIFSVLKAYIFSCKHVFVPVRVVCIWFLKSVWVILIQHGRHVSSIKNYFHFLTCYST